MVVDHKHNAPTPIPVTASTHVTQQEVAPVAPSKAASVAIARARLPSRTRARSSSVDSAREKHPLVKPTMASVRATMAADMREHTLGIGITSASAYLVGRNPDVFDDRNQFQDELATCSTS